MLRSLLLGLALLVAAPALAQGEAAAPASAAASVAADDPVGMENEQTRRVRRLSDELHSPFCPGKTLMTCTSYQAYELRKEMLLMVQEGRSDDEIVKVLKERYGAQVANPPQPWYTALVPFLPYIFLAAVVVFVFRRWRKGGKEAAAVPTAPLTDADAERLARLRALADADD